MGSYSHAPTREFFDLLSYYDVFSDVVILLVCWSGYFLSFFFFCLWLRSAEGVK